MVQKRQKAKLTLQVEADKERAEWKTHMFCTFEKVTLWTCVHMCVALHLLDTAASSLLTSTKQHTDDTKMERKYFHTKNTYLMADSDKALIDYVVYDAKKGDLCESLYFVQYTRTLWLDVHPGWFSHMGWVLFCVHALIPGPHPSHMHVRKCKARQEGLWSLITSDYLPIKT